MRLFGLPLTGDMLAAGTRRQIQSKYVRPQPVQVTDFVVIMEAMHESVGKDGKSSLRRGIVSAVAGVCVPA